MCNAADISGQKLHMEASEQCATPGGHSAVHGTVATQCFWAPSRVTKERPLAAGHGRNWRPMRTSQADSVRERHEGNWMMLASNSLDPPQAPGCVGSLAGNRPAASPRGTLEGNSPGFKIERLATTETTGGHAPPQRLLSPSGARAGAAGDRHGLPGQNGDRSG